MPEQHLATAARQILADRRRIVGAVIVQHRHVEPIPCDRPVPHDAQAGGGDRRHHRRDSPSTADAESPAQASLPFEAAGCCHSTRDLPKRIGAQCEAGGGCAVTHCAAAVCTGITRRGRRCQTTRVGLGGAVSAIRLGGLAGTHSPVGSGIFEYSFDAQPASEASAVRTTRRTLPPGGMSDGKRRGRRQDGRSTARQLGAADGQPKRRAAATAEGGVALTATACAAAAATRSESQSEQ